MALIAAVALVVAVVVVPSGARGVSGNWLSDDFSGV